MRARVDPLAVACARLLLAMHGEPRPNDSDLLSDTADRLNALADAIWEEAGRAAR